jgi:nucleoside-diphosphate-sugar epimerase
MRVVVTGAAGQIGGQVAAGLVGRGHEVVAIDRVPPTQRDAAPGVAVTWHVGEVRDVAFMNDVMSRTRPDALAHLAAIPRPSLGTPLEVFATNTEATFVALEAAGDAGVGRVVIASSTSALGTVFPVEAAAPVSPMYAPVDEDHPFLGSDPYALSKQVDEATGAMMQRRHGYQVVAVRIPNTGPMDAQIARAARVAADPSILANELWAYLDVRDAVRAFALALERDLPGCHVINVMAPDTNSPERTVDLLARFHPTTRLRGPIDGRSVPFDLARARALLGFEAEHLLSGDREADSGDRRE